MAVLGLRFCARAFSSCGKRGPLFIAVCRPLTIVASLVAEHRLQMCRLSSWGSRAQLLHGMWDLPRPGLEPVSAALAGRFSTTAPPGKPDTTSFDNKGRAQNLHLRVMCYFYVTFIIVDIVVITIITEEAVSSSTSSLSCYTGYCSLILFPCPWILFLIVIQKITILTKNHSY